MKAILAFLVAACAWAPIARAQIEQPRLGTMLTRDSAPRAVFGVAGSVTIGAPPAAGCPTSGGILSMGCSRQICLMKTELALISASGVVDAPAGPALFWFESVTKGNVNGAAGDSALVYFPGSRQLARWQNGQLSPIDFDLAGEILSIREASDGTLEFAIRNRAGTWIVRNGNAIVESVHASAGLLDSAGPVGSALLLPSGVLFQTDVGLVLRRPDESELVFKIEQVEVESSTCLQTSAYCGPVEPLADARGSATASDPPPSGSGARGLPQVGTSQAGQVVLSWLGENYVQVRVRGSLGNGSNYALRIDLGHERLFLLPEPQP